MKKLIDEEYAKEFGEDGSDPIHLTLRARKNLDMMRDVLGFMDHIIEDREKEVAEDMTRYKKKADALRKVIYLPESGKDLKQLYDEYLGKYEDAKLYYRHIMRKKGLITRLFQDKIGQHKEIIDIVKPKHSKEYDKNLKTYVG